MPVAGYDDWKGRSDRDEAGPDGEPCEHCGLECFAPKGCRCCGECIADSLIGGVAPLRRRERRCLRHGAYEGSFCPPCTDESDAHVPEW